MMDLNALPCLTRRKVEAQALHSVANLMVHYLCKRGQLPTRVELAVLTSTQQRSRELVDQIGWGVWCHEQLEAVREHAPRLLEVGAGNGFFGVIAKAYGLRVRLTEKAPLARNRFYRQPLSWSKRREWIERLSAVNAMADDPDVPVLLSWPPGEQGYVGRVTAQTMGMQVAKALPHGGRLLYLGDAAMCAAGGEGFRAQIAASFRELARVPGPCWAKPAAPEMLLVLEKL
jgi:hypothetical protein